eukprot:2345279-Pleurochrysis_carterae.AAC.1
MCIRDSSSGVFRIKSACSGKVDRISARSLASHASSSGVGVRSNTGVACCAAKSTEATTGASPATQREWLLFRRVCGANADKCINENSCRLPLPQPPRFADRPLPSAPRAARL